MTDQHSTAEHDDARSADPVALPPTTPTTALTETLAQRRSQRSFTDAPVALAHVGQLLWAAYGTTPYGRTVPSAHGLYGLECTVVAGHVGNMSPAAYGYEPASHSLRRYAAGDHRTAVADAALVDQAWLRLAPLLLVISADYTALAQHFADQPSPAERGRRYAHIEFGHLSQNVYLSAAELGLAAVLVAGTDDDRLHAALTTVLRRDGAVDPLGVIAVGETARRRQH